MSDIKKYDQLFEYLRTPDAPTEAHGVLVFGRHDLRLVESMGRLASKKLAKYFVVSGGLGKDSGHLHELGIPEGAFLASAATAQPHAIPGELVHAETQARHGGENVSLSYELMDEKGLPRGTITALAHATSLRRLAATAEHQGSQLAVPTTKVHRVPTDYPFDPNNPRDQYESAAEFMRLVEGPSNGFLQTPDDLPADLIEFARHARDLGNPGSSVT